MEKSSKNLLQKKSRTSLASDNDVSTGVAGVGEDSDYYTPEDPHTTILSPVSHEKVIFI